MTISMMQASPWNALCVCGTYQVIQDLVADYADHLETLLAADRIDDHVPVDADEVLAVEYTILVLACRVDHFH
jgi:hypothetical protein